VSPPEPLSVPPGALRLPTSPRPHITWHPTYQVPGIPHSVPEVPGGSGPRTGGPERWLL